jgi:hypothetical protein
MERDERRVVRVQRETEGECVSKKGGRERHQLNGALAIYASVSPAISG